MVGIIDIGTIEKEKRMGEERWKNLFMEQSKKHWKI
jgi:hypothetical protein